MIFRFLKNNIEKTHENTKDFLDFMPRISETQQKIMVHNIFEQIIKTLLEPYYGATYRLQDLFCQLIDILSNAQYYHVQHDVHHGRGGKHAEKHKKNVSQIMEELHFSNRTHFYKLFNEHYHMTPRQYRETHTEFHNKPS